eukprot:Clim_evm62s152 gene=Clim_evmTU62s152
MEYGLGTLTRSVPMRWIFLGLLCVLVHIACAEVFRIAPECEPCRAEIGYLLNLLEVKKYLETSCGENCIVPMKCDSGFVTYGGACQMGFDAGPSFRFERGFKDDAMGPNILMFVLDNIKASDFKTIDGVYEHMPTLHKITSNFGAKMEAIATSDDADTAFLGMLTGSFPNLGQNRLGYHREMFDGSDFQLQMSWIEMEPQGTPKRTPTGLCQLVWRTSIPFILRKFASYNNGLFGYETKDYGISARANDPFHRLSLQTKAGTGNYMWTQIHGMGNRTCTEMNEDDSSLLKGVRDMTDWLSECCLKSKTPWLTILRSDVKEATEDDLRYVDGKLGDIISLLKEFKAIEKTIFFVVGMPEKNNVLVPLHIASFARKNFDIAQGSLPHRISLAQIAQWVCGTLVGITPLTRPWETPADIWTEQEGFPVVHLTHGIGSVGIVTPHGLMSQSLDTGKCFVGASEVTGELLDACNGMIQHVASGNCQSSFCTGFHPTHVRTILNASFAAIKETLDETDKAPVADEPFDEEPVEDTVDDTVDDEAPVDDTVDEAPEDDEEAVVNDEVQVNDDVLADDMATVENEPLNEAPVDDEDAVVGECGQEDDETLGEETVDDDEVAVDDEATEVDNEDAIEKQGKESVESMAEVVPEPVFESTELPHPGERVEL